MSEIEAETYYPYQPPAREYDSTLLAFGDFQTASAWKVVVKPDPLGPINKIVTLVHNDEPVKSVLHPVNEGDTVQLIRDEGGLNYNHVSLMHGLHWHNNEYGQNVAEAHVPFRKPGWRVEINGGTVLTVTDAELQPTPPPTPRTPLWRRMRRTLLEQLRSDADAIAGRLGYHRDDNCDRWDY